MWTPSERPEVGAIVDLIVWNVTMFAAWIACGLVLCAIVAMFVRIFDRAKAPVVDDE